MTEHRDEHLDLCAAAALGSLDPIDRERLDEHLATGCPECEAALRDFSVATVKLASSSPPAVPSPALRERVLEAVARTVPESRAEGGRVIALPPRRSASWLTWTFAAAAAAFAVASVIFWNNAEHLRLEIESHQRAMADVESRLAEQERLNEVLSAPGARVAVLELTPAGEQALRARATYDPASRKAVLVFENFTAPAGRDYELWAIRGAAPVSLGLIETDAAGRAVMEIDDAGDPSTLNAFAISLEPAGGSPNPNAPSGPVVMLGKLGG